MGLFKQFIYFFDSFQAPATLRVGGNPETSSLCSGFFSILIIGFFAYIFAIKTHEVLTFQQVSSSSVMEDKIGQRKEGEIMFGINILEQHGSLHENQYFQFYASVQDK